MLFIGVVCVFQALSLLPKPPFGEGGQEARVAPSHLNVFLNLATLISRDGTRLHEADEVRPPTFLRAIRYMVDTHDHSIRTIGQCKTQNPHCVCLKTQLESFGAEGQKRNSKRFILNDPFVLFGTMELKSVRYVMVRLDLPNGLMECEVIVCESFTFRPVQIKEL